LETENQALIVLKLDIGPEKVLIFDFKGAEKSARLVRCSRWST